MQTHQARDEEFVAKLVGLVAVADVFDRVVEQQGVAGGAVDDAVQDVGYYFTLGWVLGMRVSKSVERGGL